MFSEKKKWNLIDIELEILYKLWKMTNALEFWGCIEWWMKKLNLLQTRIPQLTTSGWFTGDMPNRNISFLDAALIGFIL